MKFTKLRLVGFKTFVEPTDFLIETGLTGVVGPNGCGKSNLVEAMRWVMGENSYKNMRASGMDDVIFSGSHQRPARNAAEVVLFLDNADRRAPAALNGHDLLEVSRRIERESGSVYRINGKDVRARDVQMLFADASTGARSPAMVRQGQIGELIAAKPTQRRAILEEASGISGLHSRRNEAEIRLRAAEQNLERLEDVLTQIDGQLDGLKRQARQASRYRLLSAEIRQSEAAIAWLKWVAAREQLAEAEAALAEAERRQAEAAAAQGQTARDQAVAAHDLPALREAHAAAGATLQRLRLAVGEIEAEGRRVRERLAEIDRRLIQLAEDRAREERLAGETGDAVATLDAEAADLTMEAEDDAERAAELADGLAEAEARLAEAEAEESALRGVAADVVARRAALEREAAAAAQRVARLADQTAMATSERDALAAQVAALDGLSLEREAAEAAAEAAETAESVAQEAEEAVRSARAAADRARGPVGEAERALNRLETEARTLSGLLQVDGLDLWPPVIDQIEVEPGLEAALAAALGDDLDAGTDPAAPVHWRQPGAVGADPVLPAGTEPLAAHVRAPALMARCLAQVGLVEAADGPALQKRLAAGQRLVSRAGDLWRWDGLVMAAGAPTAAAQRLSGRNRLAALEGLVETARATHQALKAAADQARMAIGAAEARERSARETLRDVRRKAEAARDALIRAERAAGECATRLAGAEVALARLVVEAAEAAEAVATSRAALEALPVSAGLEERLAGLRAAVATARAEAVERRAAAQGLAREADLRRRRLETIARERAAWLVRAENARGQLSVLDRRREEAEIEKEALVDRPDELAAHRIALGGEIARAETGLVEAAEALAVAERHGKETDRIARAALEALSAARETRGRAEERQAAARGRAAEIERTIAETFETAPAGLAALAGLDPAARRPDLGALETRLERVKIEREKLGGVNLRADDEAREVETRRDTLVGERDDLIEAIKRLRQGIASLNREARERLMAAFETVNGHFRSLFTHLFGGGTAELQLVESDDPLEAGLEIMARPPGKKPSTMTLLSGGEQALTAMALIFAVFLTNPAPICVLDEVDAPLDDANVERYCDLLDDMSRRTDTRFVVITHNPITMARMDRLFGVTMAERGVSQLVSVDLERAERFLEAV
ncbi:chromosome segregation SMC family protein [Prosthecodimorpha staleyi]|uniref:Chromosome partition protein Smc n=1 Tax=Prosthecodimorpha staleyi TaxID=2840188 RepID=A0A947D6G2_9HYPH|nr:AAA family ATPase [Prosthecodimorpha staleyi]MBT9291945.1 AAA family ATPase [Prosthecodimorpha staleyi]